MVPFSYVSTWGAKKSAHFSLQGVLNFVYWMLHLVWCFIFSSPFLLKFSCWFQPTSFRVIFCLLFDQSSISGSKIQLVQKTTTNKYSTSAVLIRLPNSKSQTYWVANYCGAKNEHINEIKPVWVLRWPKNRKFFL